MPKPDCNKYGYDAIMSPKKIKKGQTRWNQVERIVEKVDASLLKGPILDFGSGNGYFLFEGLRRNRNIWGVDILKGKFTRYRKLIDFSKSPEIWKQRACVGDGASLPFQSNFFSICTSWWVLEHVPEPEPVLEELVRVTIPGGIIALRAQDAASGWEGHCNIPWIPFLPKSLETSWVESFGVSPQLREGVYNIAQEEVIRFLEKFGCEIVAKQPPPEPLPKLLQQKVKSVQEVRLLAEQVRKCLGMGEFAARADGLYVYARKKP
jgi:SAM-dependent methyltransferase